MTGAARVLAFFSFSFSLFLAILINNFVPGILFFFSFGLRITFAGSSGSGSLIASISRTILLAARLRLAILRVFMASVWAYIIHLKLLFINFHFLGLAFRLAWCLFWLVFFESGL